jgi:vacuolar-type H+-ATPase subunit E/Vma4
LGLHDILDTIRLESEQTAAGLIAEAEAQAERVLARAREAAADEERAMAGSRDDRLRSERARILSLGYLQAAEARRKAREKVYEDAINRLIGKLGEIRLSDRYPDLLGSLFDEAVATMPDARTVRVDHRDSQLVEQILAERHLDTEVEMDNIPLGGVVLVAPRRTVDNRIETRLQRAESHLRFVAGHIIPALRGDPA